MMKMEENAKPLGRKSYGSIGHFPTSRLGEGEHKITDGQYKICTEKPRDRHDIIIVQEKLDGSNVGICKLNGQILAITRAGYLADTSPYEMHHMFSTWLKNNKNRFDFLNDRERACGEWLVQAHGTKYDLPHEPFVIFDLMLEEKRLNYLEFIRRSSKGYFVYPKLISYGKPVELDWVLKRLEPSGHGALEKVEGAVWRVERKGEVDFLAKYVRPDKVDGSYLIKDEVKLEPTWNTWK